MDKEFYVVSYHKIIDEGNGITNEMRALPFSNEDKALKQFEQLIIQISNESSLDVQDYLELQEEKDYNSISVIEKDFNSERCLINISPFEIHIAGIDNRPFDEWHLKLEKVELDNVYIDYSSSEEIATAFILFLLNMSASNQE